MKKLFLIAAALFVAISFSACSDDDKDINPNLIIGAWQITHDIGYVIEDGVRQDFIQEYNNNYGQIYVFNEDRTGTFTVIDPETGVEDPSRLEYFISNNILTLTVYYYEADKDGYDDIDTTRYKIKKLTATELMIIHSNEKSGSFIESTETYKRVK